MILNGFVVRNRGVRGDHGALSGLISNAEVKSQAISYTTGVPPVSGAAMFFKGEWKGAGVFNVEEFPAKPFLEDVAKRGLPWHVKDVDYADQVPLFEVET